MPLTGLAPLDSSWQPARFFVINDRRLQANRVDHRSFAGFSLHNLGSGQQVAAGARRRGRRSAHRSAVKFSCSGGATMCPDPNTNPTTLTPCHPATLILPLPLPNPYPCPSPSPSPLVRAAAAAHLRRRGGAARVRGGPARAQWTAACAAAAEATPPAPRPELAPRSAPRLELALSWL